MENYNNILKEYIGKTLSFSYDGDSSRINIGVGRQAIRILEVGNDYIKCEITHYFVDSYIGKTVYFPIGLVLLYD